MYELALGHPAQIFYRRSHNFGLIFLNILNWWLTIPQKEEIWEYQEVGVNQ